MTRAFRYRGNHAHVPQVYPAHRTPPAGVPPTTSRAIANLCLPILLLEPEPARIAIEFQREALSATGHYIYVYIPGMYELNNKPLSYSNFG